MNKWLLISLLCLPHWLLAQIQLNDCNLSLKGSVIDQHNGEVLPFTTVVIKEQKLATVSDSAGNFSFSKLCPGNYTLITSHLDCENVETTLIVNKDQNVIIHMEHHAKELQKFVFSAEKNQLQQSLNKSSVSLRKLESSSGKSLGEIIKNINGVSSLKTGNNISKPVIHGLFGNRIIIFNNGVRQEGQQWGSEHGPEIDPFVADKIEVVKGASGVRYGPDAIAGVVLLEAPELRDSSGYDGIINIAGASNGSAGTLNAIINGNVKELAGLSFRLQGTLKQGGNTKAPNYYLKNTGFNEKNFSTAIGYKKERWGTEVFYSQFTSKLGILSAAHIGNLTDLERAFHSDRPADTAGFSYDIQRPYQYISHGLLKWKSYVNLKRAGKLSYTISRQSDDRSEYDKHGPLNDSLAALNKPELSFVIHTLIHDVNYEIQHKRGFNTQVGYLYMHQANHYEGRYFIPNFNNKGWGAYLIEHYHKRNFFAETGIRYDERKLRVFLDHNGYIKQPLYLYKNYAALLGGGYHFKYTDIKVNLGSGWRAPSVNELYANGVHHGAAAVEIGDVNLKPESNINFSLWCALHPNKWLTGEVEVYRNFIKDFIYLIPVQPATQTIRGAFPTFRYKQLDAVLQGIDLQLKHTINTSWSVQFRGNYLYAMQANSQIRLTQMPQNSYSPSITWEPQLNNSYFTNVYATVEYNIFSKAPISLNDEDYLPPPPGYQLLNLDAGVQIPFKNQKLKFGFSIENALNTRYRSYLNRYRYFADDTGINILIHVKLPIKFY